LGVDNGYANPGSRRRETRGTRRDFYGESRCALLSGDFSNSRSRSDESACGATFIDPP
jgi:hypothetical protein